MRLPDLHLDLRPRIAALLAQPRVAVSLVALVLVVVPLGILTHGLDDPGRRDGLRLVAGAPGVHTYRVLTTDADFGGGVVAGSRAGGGSVVTRTGTLPRRTWGGRSFEYGAWRSAWVAPGQTFAQLVPSWNVLTPAGAWVQVLVQVRDSTGRVSSFKDLGRWSTRDGVVRRSSAETQADAVADVATDTLRARPGVTLTSYRFMVRLMRLPGRTGPTLRAIGAVVSRMPVGTPATSSPLSTTPVTLAVPSYSQMTHRGQDPRYGGGGEAWCSPTSVAMLLGYYHRLPTPAEYAWAPYRQAWVNHVARQTYDVGYRGTGNWPFNTALAATRVGDAFVTRLPDLRAAERLVRAGIPIAVSVRFSRGQLTGAPISSTAGHLLVLVGFTSSGRPVVNDPAASTDAGVRRSYDRAQFERAWIGGSAGMAYVVRDAAHPLPARAGLRSW
ncbi:peptidase C39 family protein [Marmoricola sp. RAF53]|uniref:peptidase C39 family protein n=1 Tax=Marmoricola sp. RAF53 TaxID=3233059 RepID=UPI003F9B93C6